MRVGLRRCIVAAATALFGGGAAATAAVGGELPRQPILQLATPMHTAAIRDLAVDVEAGLVATASTDKTLRLWSRDSGDLLATVRVPLAPGAEGALHVAAVSDDGKVGVLTGITGAHWDGHPVVYLANLEKGQVVTRLARLPSDVLAAAFFPDSKTFVLGFAEGGGIAVIDLKRGLVDSDRTDYGGRVNGISIAPDGWLAVSESDGQVHLYASRDDRTLDKAGSYRAPDGLTPARVAFSPDGRDVAVGYFDAGRVDVIDPASFRVRHTLKAGARDEALNAVGWSQSGRDLALFAGGTVTGADGRRVIRRWSGRGFRESRDLPVAADTVLDIVGLADGGVVFATADPTWGRLSHDGAVRYQHVSATRDFRDIAERDFGVSPDGMVVDLPAGRELEGYLRFDLRQQRLSRSPRPAAQHAPPHAGARDLGLASGWKNAPDPRLNGRELALDRYELARSVAVLPEREGLLLGGDFKLRWFDARGRLRAETQLPAAAWAVDYAAEAGMAVAALADGTLRWYRLDRSAGRFDERLALFAPVADRRWLLWTPDGFFSHAALGGQDLAGYARNVSKKRSPDWITFKQLYRKYYLPDVVAAQLRPDGPQLAAAALDRLGDVQTTINSAPRPKVEITRYCQLAPDTTRSFSRVRETGDDLQLAGEACRPVDSRTTRAMVRVAPDAADGPDGPDGPDAPDAADAGDAAGEGGEPAMASVTEVLPAATDQVVLEIEVTDRGGGAGQPEVFLNGKVVERRATRGFARIGGSGSAGSDGATASNGPSDGGGGTKLYRRVVPLHPDQNEFQVRVYNTDNVMGESAVLRLQRDPAASRGQQRVLHVLAVGIDQYRSPSNRLQYAVKDADGFASAVERLKPAYYDDVSVTRLFDAEATAPNVIRALEQMAESARSEDRVLIYLAGHGAVEDGGYHFATVDVHGREQLAERGLSADALMTQVSLIRAQNIFVFLDTCHAGAAYDSRFRTELAGRLGSDMGHSLLMATESDQLALDRYDDHGVFATAVLAGLNGEAPAYRDSIQALSLGHHVMLSVENLAGDKRHVQSAEFLSFGVVKRFPIARAQGEIQ